MNFDSLAFIQFTLDQAGCPAGLEKIEKIEKIEKGSFAAVGLEKA